MWLHFQASFPCPIAFDVHDGVFNIGRSLRCQIAIDEPSIAPIHARLTCQRNTPAILEALGTDAVTVSGKKVDRCELLPPAVVWLGSVVIQISADDTKGFSKPNESHSSDSSQVFNGRHVPAILRPMQQKVLALNLEGFDVHEIAVLLHRSFSTIHKHELAVFKAFRVHSRADLLGKYLRGGNTLSA